VVQVAVRGRGVHDQAVHREQAEDVAEGVGQLKHVLERARVDHAVGDAVVRERQVRVVQIVNDLRALVVGDVEREAALEAEALEEGRPIQRAVRVGSGAPRAADAPAPALQRARGEAQVRHAQAHHGAPPGQVPDQLGEHGRVVDGESHRE